jgi:hypothetical protein
MCHSGTKPFATPRDLSAALTTVRRKTMAKTTFWTQDQFPIVFEGDQATAVLVDIASFAQMELIVDNLLNREGEPEDAILAASTILKRLAAQARQAPPSTDWERELDEL